MREKCHFQIWRFVEAENGFHNDDEKKRFLDCCLIRAWKSRVRSMREADSHHHFSKSIVYLPQQHTTTLTVALKAPLPSYPQSLSPSLSQPNSKSSETKLSFQI